MQPRVEDRPRDPARLRVDLCRLFRIARRLVREAVAVEVHLEATFHDQRPENGHAMPDREPAMPLIALHVAGRGAQRFAPGDRIALVAEMPVEHRARHFGDEPLDHVAVAAEAGAGEDQGVATDVLRGAIGPSDADAGDPVAVGVQRLDGRVGQQRHARAFSGRLERTHQFAARATRRAVHPPRAVPGVQEAVDQIERHAVDIAHPCDRVG
ncbi:hypothetical protein QP178_15125 [Sphingomonas aurantiaca]